MSAVELVGVIWFVDMKALGMGIHKLVLGLSLVQIVPEKINKILCLNNLGFIDVNRTVSRLEKKYFEFQVYSTRISRCNKLKLLSGVQSKCYKCFFSKLGNP